MGALMKMMGMGGGKNPAERLKETLCEKGFDAFVYESPLDQMKKQIEDYIREKSMRLKEEIVAKASESNGIKVMQFVGKANADAMKNVAFQIKAETTDSFVFVAGIIDDNKCTLMLMLSDDLVKEGLHAGKIVKEAAKHIQGGGGGQPHFATAGGKNMEGLSIAVGAVKEAVGVQ